MSITPEKRSQVRHLVSTTILNENQSATDYSYEWHLINEGVTDLSEEFNADEEDLQYIAEDNATHTVKRYAPSISLSAVMVNGDPVNTWMRNIINILPTGTRSKTAYVRFNILETGTKPSDFTEQSGHEYKYYVGYKRDAVVSVGSIGGSAGDNVGMECTISGTGDQQEGTVIFDTTANTFTFNTSKSTVRTINFTVQNNSGSALGDASVIFNNQIKTTNEEGKTSFSASDGGVYPYTISKDEYDSFSTNIKISKDEDITQRLTSK